MGIIHIRVDDRLIHGQVAAMWTHHLSATRIIVVDDKATNDEMLKMYLKLSTPNGVSLSVLSVQKASEQIRRGIYDSQRVFIIVRSAKTLCELLEQGVKIDEVNVGNLAYAEGNIKVSDTVSLSKDNMDNFRKLINDGVKLTMRLVPSNASDDFSNLLNSL